MAGEEGWAGGEGWAGWQGSIGKKGKWRSAGGVRAAASAVVPQLGLNRAREHTPHLRGGRSSCGPSSSEVARLLTVLEALRPSRSPWGSTSIVMSAGFRPDTTSRAVGGGPSGSAPCARQTERAHPKGTCMAACKGTKLRAQRAEGCPPNSRRDLCAFWHRYHPTLCVCVCACVRARVRTRACETPFKHCHVYVRVPACVPSNVSTSVQVQAFGIHPSASPCAAACRSKAHTTAAPPPSVYPVCLLKCPHLHVSP